MTTNYRKSIYYWKSDRPYIHGNVQSLDKEKLMELEGQLFAYLNANFLNGLIELRTGGGQGNHVTFLAVYPNQTFFVRVENGPEKDDYMDVETAILKKVHAIGIPSPKVFHSDVTRKVVPFAVQVIEYIESKDLNILEKNGELNILDISKSIGEYVAKWQTIKFDKFGLLNPNMFAEQGILEGYHITYKDYFFLNWEMHLTYLREALFLSENQVAEIREIVDAFKHLLDINKGSLVHKDLALWNILGNATTIHAFIDWSDTISGDLMDDISLLGCFHTGEVMENVLIGYSRIKQLPNNYEDRFWLHLLRNIIFKAVIRVKGNYFDKPSSFFMNNKHKKDLKTFTLERIALACEGLKGKKNIRDL